MADDGWSKDDKKQFWTQKLQERAPKMNDKRRDALMAILERITPGKPRSEPAVFRTQLIKIEALKERADMALAKWSKTSIIDGSYQVDRLVIEAYCFISPYTGEKGRGKLLDLLTEMGVKWDAKDGHRTYPDNWPSDLVSRGDPWAYTVANWRKRVRAEKHATNSKSTIQYYSVPNDETVLSFNSRSATRHSFTIDMDMYQEDLTILPAAKEDILKYTRRENPVIPDKRKSDDDDGKGTGRDADAKRTKTDKKAASRNVHFDDDVIEVQKAAAPTPNATDTTAKAGTDAVAHTSKAKETTTKPGTNAGTETDKTRGNAKQPDNELLKTIADLTTQLDLARKAKRRAEEERDVASRREEGTAKLAAELKTQLGEKKEQLIAQEAESEALARENDRETLKLMKMMRAIHKLYSAAYDAVGDAAKWMSVCGVSDLDFFKFEHMAEQMALEHGEEQDPNEGDDGKKDSNDDDGKKANDGDNGQKVDDRDNGQQFNDGQI